jgi:hypothetical protein
MGDAVVNSTMNDSNVRYNLEATANVKTTYPTLLKMQLQLDTINLYALHFMDSFVYVAYCYQC